jgi:glycosyltransferase involved in cell wall biosynthesis
MFSHRSLLRAIDPMKTPRISVIIPAHNEELYLPPTLEALQKQTYPDFEVIVVANGCTDRTEQVAQGKCDRVFSLEKGLSRARNIGAKKARGELLVFIDADTLVAPDALEVIARRFTRGCSCGTFKGLPDQPKPSYRLLYLFKNLLHQLRLHRGSSGVILCWKDQFRQVGGFDERMEVCENGDLMRRLASSGKYEYISDTASVTSMRRYDKAGPRMCWFWVKHWFIRQFRDVREHQYETVR